MKNELLDSLNALLAEEDLISNIREVNQLKYDFDDWLLKQENLQQVAVLKAKEDGKEIETEDYSLYKEEFYQAYSRYKELRKKQIEIRTQLESENLKQKTALISDLKELVEKEENIGSAFKKFKEIQETWKKIGDLPRSKRDSVQKEYSRLRELFFYNINIYREIKEHDYKRNAQLKEKVIYNLQKLRNSDSHIREIEKLLRSYQDEWEDIGPVQNEEWESLKSSYWEAVRSIYEKINKHYDEYRQIQNENLAKKREIIEAFREMIQSMEPSDLLKEWNRRTNVVKTFQDEWKKIGFASKKENDKIWKEFRGLCNDFFALRKEFFKSRDLDDQKSRDRKRGLIDKAKELKESEEWVETTKKFIQLQKEWKKVPNAGRYERALWEEFRSICDAFFNKRESTSKEMKAALNENLILKKKAITGFKKNKLGKKETSMDEIKKEMEVFINVGPVPKSDSKGIYEEFQELLRQQLHTIGTDLKETEVILFRFKMECYANYDWKKDQYLREKNFLKKRITSLEGEIFQSENNLGFFSISKGAEKLFADINSKNEKMKEEIALLKRKLKMVPNE